jgi:predicted ATPase
MLQRLYAHNFRCLENFEFRPADQHAALLLGKNGSGKSTVRQVLAIFQAIGRGESQVKELVKAADFTRGRSDVPMSFELEALLGTDRYRYEVAFDLPSDLKALRVLRESLTVNDEVVYQRQLAEVSVNRRESGRDDAVFAMDWHLVALPVVQDRATSRQLQNLRDWLRRMVLLSPLPPLMVSETSGEAPALRASGSNLVDWLGSLLESHPTAYSTVIEHLQAVMPDLELFRFEKLGRDSRALLVRFKSGQISDEQPFDRLSDGEKCFFLGAVLLAANHWDGPVFAFWDEPDNYLAAHEVNQFVVALKRSFVQRGGQLITSSHNPQAALCFSQDSTWVMGRRSHLEPCQIRCLDELETRGKEPESSGPDLMQRMLDGEIDPWL